MKTLEKYTFILFCAVLSLIANTACSSDEPEPPAVEEPDSEPSNPGDPNPPAIEESTHRTLIIYMAADNNLYTYSKYNLADIKTAVKNGALQGGRIILYYDNPDDIPYLAEITEDTGDFVKIKDYDNNLSSLDPDRMNAIIHDAIDIAPADEYALILWSHGTGWINESNSRAKPDIEFTPFSFGADSYGPDGQRQTVTMSVTSLAQALDDFNFRFIYFDCCFMSTVEALYELRNCADYIYSSPTELPVEGMPYLTNIPEMMSRDIDFVKIAQNTLTYYLSPGASEPWCTITLVDTSWLQELADITEKIMAAGALNDEDYQPLPYFRSAVKSYTWDLADFINNLPVDNSLIAEWNSVFDKAVEYYGHTAISYYVSMDGTAGLGAFFYSEDTAHYISLYGYDTLSWWKDVVSHNPNINP